MTKKAKNKEQERWARKVTHQWATFLVYVTIGAELTSLRTVQPGEANGIAEEAISAVQGLAKEAGYVNNAGAFIVDAVAITNQVYNAHLTNLLMVYLENGIPTAPRIFVENASIIN